MDKDSLYYVFKRESSFIYTHLYKRRTYIKNIILKNTLLKLDIFLRAKRIKIYLLFYVCKILCGHG